MTRRLQGRLDRGAGRRPSVDLHDDRRSAPSTLPNPVMTASGTAGPRRRAGAPTSTSARSGAVVVKSLAAVPVGRQPGAPAARRAGAGCSTPSGLQGPGVAAWLARRPARAVADRGPRGGQHLGPHRRRVRARPPSLLAARAECRRGRRGQPVLPEPGGPQAHVRPLARRPPGGDGRHRRRAGRPRWAKLSATTADLAEIAAAAADAGAEAVTLVNTLLGHGARPVDAGRPVLGAGGGRAVRPGHPPGRRAGRATTCTRPLPDLPIVGVGGVAAGGDAVELLLAGAVGGPGRARPPSPTPGRRPGCSTSCSEWCAAPRRGVGRPSRRPTAHRRRPADGRHRCPPGTISPSPSTSTRSRRLRLVAPAATRGSAWPRSASSCSPPPGPTPCGAVRDAAATRRVRRPQAARHPDHRAAGRPACSAPSGVDYLTITPPAARSMVRAGVEGFEQGAAEAGHPPPSRWRHRAHQRRRRRRRTSSTSGSPWPSRPGLPRPRLLGRWTWRRASARTRRAARSCPGIRPRRRPARRPGPHRHARRRRRRRCRPPRRRPRRHGRAPTPRRRSRRGRRGRGGARA